MECLMSSVGTLISLVIDSSVTSFCSVPEDGFLVGCVFAIADYPEQMADKQLLATWKRVRLRILILQFKLHLFNLVSNKFKKWLLDNHIYLFIYIYNADHSGVRRLCGLRFEPLHSLTVWKSSQQHVPAGKHTCLSVLTKVPFEVIWTIKAFYCSILLDCVRLWGKASVALRLTGSTRCWRRRGWFLLTARSTCPSVSPQEPNPARSTYE